MHALEACVDRLAHSTKPPEIFRVLLDGSRLGAPRAAIFLWRQGVLRGWACRDYPLEAAGQLRHLSVAPGQTWLGEVLESSEPSALGSDQDGPDFGQPPAVETWALPIRIGPRTLAVVLAERSEGDPALDISALKLITAVARLRLEVDLAWRKLRAATGTTAAPAAVAPPTADMQADLPAHPDPKMAVSEPVPQPEPAVDVAIEEPHTGLVPAPDPAEQPERAADELASGLTQWLWPQRSMAGGNQRVPAALPLAGPVASRKLAPALADPRRLRAARAAAPAAWILDRGARAARRRSLLRVDDAGAPRPHPDPDPLRTRHHTAARDLRGAGGDLARTRRRHAPCGGRRWQGPRRPR